MICDLEKTVENIMLIFLQRGWNNQLCVFDLTTMQWSVPDTMVRIWKYMCTYINAFIHAKISLCFTFACIAQKFTHRTRILVHENFCPILCLLCLP